MVELISQREVRVKGDEVRLVHAALPGPQVSDH
jgi:hypothetical protein